MKKKDFVFALLFILILFIVYVFFPIEDVLQRILTTIIFFALLPILFNKYILKRRIGDLGFQIGDWKQGVIWSGISAIVIGLILFIISYFFGFLDYYTVPKIIINNYRNFVIYELVVFLFTIFIYDLFFRGFIMFILEKKVFFGLAIIIQAVVFFIFALITDFSHWTLVPYMIFAPFVGVVVHKSKSIFYSSVLQLVLLIILNASVIRLMR